MEEASPKEIAQSCLMNSNAELPHEVTDQAQVSPQDANSDSLLILLLDHSALSSVLIPQPFTSSQALTLSQPHVALSNPLPGQAQGSPRKALPPFPPESSTWLSHSLLDGTTTTAQTSEKYTSCPTGTKHTYRGGLVQT